MYVVDMRAVTSLALLLLLACGGSHKSSPPPAETTAAPDQAAVGPEAKERALQAHMLANYQRISTIHTAVIEGELEVVKENARWLVAQAPAGELDGDWIPYLENMRNDAKILAEAPDLGAAAVAASAMGRACGDCHDSVGISAVKAMENVPSGSDKSVKTYMQRHRWAAERLWDGLVGPSDEAWAQGAETLLSTSRLATELSDEIIVNPAMEVMLETIERLGEQAKTVAGRPARQRLYGQFLGTCANCHKLFQEGVD